MKLLPIFLFLLFSCCAPSQKSEKPRVLTSTPTYQYFVERISGDLLEVHSIVPPGADCHTFEPTPRQRISLEKGIIWFQIGECFESSLQGVSKKMVRVDLSKEISDSSDRHFWLSPKLAAQQVSLIAKTLSEKIPEHAAYFAENERQLQSDLTLLDRELEASLSSARGRTLLVSHPSFGHFCHDYALKQLSLEHEGKEARPRHLESLYKNAEENREQLVLIALPQHSNKGVQAIADRLNLPVKEIDPYTHDYFSMMHLLCDWVAHDGS